jgi:hypothetical protein
MKKGKGTEFIFEGTLVDGRKRSVPFHPPPAGDTQIREGPYTFILGFSDIKKPRLAGF